MRCGHPRTSTLTTQAFCILFREENVGSPAQKTVLGRQLAIAYQVGVFPAVSLVVVVLL